MPEEDICIRADVHTYMVQKKVKALESNSVANIFKLGLEVVWSHISSKQKVSVS